LARRSFIPCTAPLAVWYSISLKKEGKGGKEGGKEGKMNVISEGCVILI
jgi:hypothetical protein